MAYKSEKKKKTNSKIYSEELLQNMFKTFKLYFQIIVETVSILKLFFLNL